MLGVNLSNRLDTTLVNTYAIPKSNISPMTPSQPNDLFMDSEDNNSEGYSSESDGGSCIEETDEGLSVFCFHLLNKVTMTYEIQLFNVRSVVPMPPKVLQDLLFGSETSESRTFQQHIRTYNMMFVFTFPSAKMDNRFNNGRGPPTFRIQENEIQNIINGIREDGYRPNVKHRENTSNHANNQQTGNSEM
ncbi:hypothetical protein KIW84_053265 [Lathyrus oleraceus]|uniref:Uncharacterized protein n=1 Tax=Pisum sativum TaxID=3888 RepID=A0A9D4WUC2_PEA|nr:hypothetical protein KIW84_053265 [Pisum sativum]